ncbi:hypothetical protein Tco_0688136 [Tanacetum coccineum]
MAVTPSLRPVRMDTVMSDSKDSTVTYTAVSSPFEDLLDIRSPGVVVLGYDGLPMIPQDPYSHVEGAFQAPPSPDYIFGPEYPLSPDYIPGSEEPEEASTLLEYVPEPEYPEYMLPSDDEAPMKDQPLPDDDDDSKSDHLDYPANRRDDDDDSDDDDDDDSDEEEDPSEEEEDEEDEEEEHSAPADSFVVAAADPIPSARDTEAFETDESAATPLPHPAYRVTARKTVRHQSPIPFPSDTEVARLLVIPTPPSSPLSPWSPLPQIPSPPLPASLPLPLPPSPTHITPTYEEAPLRFRAAGIRLRDAPLSPVHETEIPNICLPLRKKLCCTAPASRFVDMVDAAIRCPMSRKLDYGITDTWDELVGAIQEIALTTLEGVNKRVSELSTTFDQETSIMYGMMEEARDDRALLKGRLMAANDKAFAKGLALWTSDLAWQAKIRELEAADRRRQEQLLQVLTLLKSCQTQLTAALGRIQTLEAKVPAQPEAPKEAGSSS